MTFIRDRKTAVIGMVLTALLWSTGGLFIKIVNGHPLAIAGMRAGIAAIFLLCIVGFKFMRLTKKIVLGTIFYTVTVVGFVTANKLTTSANAVLLQYIAPIWVAVYTALFLKDRVRKSDFISIFVMLIGLRLFFLDELEAGMMWGNIIALVTSFTFAFYFIVIKSIDDSSKIYPTIYGNILAFIIGIPFLSDDLFVLPGIGALLFLGIVQIGIAYLLYSLSMVYLKPLDAVLIPVLEPLLNPVWVFFIIGERPTPMTAMGGLLVLFSVLFRSLYQYRYKTPLNLSRKVI